LVLDTLFLLTVFFPYVTVLPFGTDLQPTCLALSCVMLFRGNISKPAPGHIWLLGYMFLAAVCTAFIGEPTFAALRSLGNYVSIFLISLASYHFFLSTKVSVIAMTKIANMVWFAVGLGQTFMSSELLTSILPDVRRTASRGVVSLAPEPGYYATTCLFFLLLLFLYKQERSIHGLICILQITLLARSSVIAMFLGCTLVVYLATSWTIRNILVVTLLAASGWVIVTQTAILENSRIHDVFALAIADPTSVAQRDESISDRVGQLVFSIKGSLENYMLPHGFSSWGRYYYSEVLQASDWLTQYWANKYPDRIQSGVGAAFYELGVFGLIVPVVFIAGAKRRFGRLGARPAVVFLTIVGLTLLPATPLATPMYGLLVGYLFAPVRPSTRTAVAFGNDSREAERLGPGAAEPCHS
jgi:hypothetical protein